ncbi:acyl-CoA dehydrogenase [Acinetobacter baumannii]|nr:acyl-CoA dehydrogenase [Acinetobacter baumannii]KJX73924.1 acyl-CoA dehydrogenase [Acinetobacter baumannii]
MSLTSNLRQFQSAARLEQILGSVHDTNNDFSWSAAIERDEKEQYPQRAVDFLNAVGMNRFYVPSELGGRMEIGEELLYLHRVLARRDLTINSTYSTNAWSVIVWIGGNANQCQNIANRILSGAAPALAYSEKAHGADLLSSEVTAQPSDSKYVLNGEKWSINRATLGDSLSLIAKTSNDRGPRSLSAFWLDKRHMASKGTYSLNRLPTVGMRGLDISGIGFNNAEIHKDALIGEEGQGLELGLKTLQVTRAYCSSFSLGAGDTMLRIATEFAIERELYNKKVISIPLVREQLATAYTYLLAAEVLSLVGARGLHVCINQFSTWSPIVKVLVPEYVESLAKITSSVLGSRFFLRNAYADGMFQKAFRDHLIVSVFDGSSTVCLDSLSFQLKSANKGRSKKADHLNQAEAKARYRQLYDLQVETGAIDFRELEIFNRDGDLVMESLGTIIEMLNDPNVTVGLSAETLATLRERANQLLVEQHSLDQKIQDYFSNSEQSKEFETLRFSLARNYAELFARIAVLGFWVFNHHGLRPALQDGAWLIIFLNAAEGQTAPPMTSLRESTLADLLDRISTNHMLSVIDFALAPRDAKPVKKEITP